MKRSRSNKLLIVNLAFVALMVLVWAMALNMCTLEVSPRFGQHTGSGPVIVGTKPLAKDASDD